jgi:hypothetical protein
MSERVAKIESRYDIEETFRNRTLPLLYKDITSLNWGSRYLDMTLG